LEIGDSKSLQISNLKSQISNSNPPFAGVRKISPTSGLDRHFGQLQGNEDKGMKRRTFFCRHSFAVILLHGCMIVGFVAETTIKAPQAIANLKFEIGDHTQSTFRHRMKLGAEPQNWERAFLDEAGGYW
jgi:hypothetical protein